VIRQEILGKLHDVFEDVFDKEEISVKENMLIKDVEEWDSLVHMMLMATIEEEFKFKFTLDEINNINSIANIIDIIERHMV
jgi:acyl carrier protein